MIEEGGRTNRAFWRTWTTSEGRVGVTGRWLLDVEDAIVAAAGW